MMVGQHWNAFDFLYTFCRKVTHPIEEINNISKMKNKLKKEIFIHKRRQRWQGNISQNWRNILCMNKKKVYRSQMKNNNNFSSALAKYSLLFFSLPLSTTVATHFAP